MKGYLSIQLQDFKSCKQWTNIITTDVRIKFHGWKMCTFQIYHEKHELWHTQKLTCYIVSVPCSLVPWIIPTSFQAETISLKLHLRMRLHLRMHVGKTMDERIEVQDRKLGHVIETLFVRSEV